jgi:hypothetical protein
MGLTERLVRLGLRQGWNRGLVEGSRVWTVVGGLALLAYLAGRVLQRGPDVVFSDQLAIGESLQITHGPKRT